MLTGDPLHHLLTDLRGVHLIDASAGTGKTYAITGLVLRLLIERGLAIREILVVTYTEAATADLRSRIREKIGQALAAFEQGTAGKELFLTRLLQDYPDHRQAAGRLAEALYSFDEAAISTIHGFCQRLLREHGLESGAMPESELLVDEQPLLREIIDDFRRLRICNRSRAFLEYGCGRLAPEKLAALLGAALHRPFLRVVPAPDADGEAAVRRSEARFEAAFAEVRRAWPGAREAVAEILQTDPGLNRNQYRVKSIPFWQEAMEAILQGDCPSPALFEHFHRFTAASVRAGTRKGRPAPVHPFFETCEELHQAQQELLAQYDRLLLALKSELISFAREELVRRKEQRNLRSFDDLLRLVYLGLSGPRAAVLARLIRRTYPAALIDEFQDTDPLQYAIFSTVYQQGAGLLFLIGDPKQAIYGFRGADIFAYLQATTEVDGRATLPVNYRSEPGLVQAVNTIFQRPQAPFVFEAIPFQPVRAAERPERSLLTIGGVTPPSFQLWLATRPEGADPVKQLDKETGRQRILTALATEIVRLLRLGEAGEARLGDRPLAAGDLAVLVRTNREARLVQEQLLLCGVDSVLHSLDSLFHTREAEELHRVLAAIGDPADQRRVRLALVTEFLGRDGGELARLQEEEADWEDLLLRFRDYHLRWLQTGFFRMLQFLLAREGVRGRLLALPEGERRLTNILHLAEVLHRAARENNLGISGVLQYLAEQRASGQETGEEHQLRLESDAARVRIVTIHKSKGLQYPVVFCPFCWEGTKVGTGDFFCHPGPAGSGQVLDLGSAEADHHRRQALREELAENLRLLYVALTRAVNRCYLVWGPFRGSETSAPAYLFHQEPGRVAPQEREEVAGRVASLADETIRAELAGLAGEAGGAIELLALPEETPPLFRPAAGRRSGLTCREFKGRIRTDWRLTSFSALTSGGRGRAAEMEDRDGVDPGRSGPPGIPGLESSDRSPATFPQGAGPGTFLHEVLEKLDFAAPNSEPGRKLIEEKLRLHGYGAEWAGTIQTMLNNVLHTPLAEGWADFVLAGIPAADRLVELEFHFPLAPVGAAELQQLFRAGQGPWSAEFVRRLGGLSFPGLRGFLKGFIDLVFVHQGRYYLVDWKSNYLGPTPEEYRRHHLQPVMAEHLYFLQYHLYVVALHRYLAARLPGYRYEEHFGGVFYLFLRGMEPRLGPGFGIFHDRPQPGLVRELEDLLAASSEGEVAHGA